MGNIEFFFNLKMKSLKKRFNRRPLLGGYLLETKTTLILSMLYINIETSLSCEE